MTLSDLEATRLKKENTLVLEEKLRIAAQTQAALRRLLAEQTRKQALLAAALVLRRSGKGLGQILYDPADPQMRYKPESVGPGGEITGWRRSFHDGPTKHRKHVFTEDELTRFKPYDI